MLGAQAQTRWPIISRGEKSLQTQDIFHELVKDTIAQDSQVKLISDMRLAIKGTNVVLNLVISPGIILIPSDMIILKERVAGYNNVLTLATRSMRFGVNKNINYSEPPKAEPEAPETSETPKAEPKAEPKATPKATPEETTPTALAVPTHSEENTYLLGSAITLGYVVAKFL